MEEDKKKKSSKENAKDVQTQVRKQLEDLLLTGESLPNDATTSGPIANDADQGPLSKVQHPSTRNMDFYEVKGGIENESKKILKSVIEFYLDAKIIKKNEYIRFKQKVDEMTLSNIMFTLTTCQHAIIKLMEEIDMGNLHPRIFEVLAQLQGQQMSIVKHQAAYMITLEEGYKKIKDDYDRVEMQKEIDAERGRDQTIDKLEGPVKSRGTKALMEGIQKNLKESADSDEDENEDYEEIKICLTDPNSRPENPMTFGKTIDKLDDENPLEIDEEMF